MHSDLKKRRSFVALLLAAGDWRRYTIALLNPLTAEGTALTRIVSFGLIVLICCYFRVAVAIDVKPTPNDDDIPKPIPIEMSLAGAEHPELSRFLHVRSAYEASLSPDGTQVAFSTQITGIPQLWVVDARGGWPRQLTFGESITFHQWSPTGEWIIYGTDRGGNEREGFYLTRPDGKQERELLSPSKAFRRFGEFTRDGKKIAYATTERNGVDFDLHLLDVATGRDRLVFQGRMGLYPVSWRPDGGAILLSEDRGEDANNIYLFELESQKLETLFKPEVASSYKSYSWVPDGSGFYLITNQERDFSGLAYYDIVTKNLSYRETPPHDLEQVALSPDGELLSWIVNDGGYSVLHLRNLKTGENISPPKELPRGIYSIEWAMNAHVATITISAPQIPGDIWTWLVDRNELYRATESTAAGLELSELVIPTHFDFPARDGITLHGLLYLPTNLKPGEKPPVLLSVHGGPTSQARPRFNPAHQYLLSTGIAVFDLNFRGSTGYGKNFARLNDRRLRELEIYDLADAIDWLRREEQVDADRVAVMGESYGGYLTMAAVTRIPEYFDAGVALVGVSNWITALEGASPELKASDRIEYGDISAPEERAFFERLSPITHVANVKAPVMVLHGANDPRVPVTESDQFVRAIRERGGQVEYLRFPDEGHELRKLSNRIIAYHRIAKFLESNLKH